MKKLIIAIIDDGICEKEIASLVQMYSVSGCTIIQDDSSVIPASSHGTICAKIIKKYCHYVEFISIRVLNNHGIGNIDDLIIALEWCSQNIVDIINLSIGVTQFFDLRPLYDKYLSLINKGVRIVAAQKNKDVCTYPADFPFVISVEQPRAFRSKTLRKSNIYIRGNHRVFINSQKIITERCNSYACAYVTGLLARKILKTDNPQAQLKHIHYCLSDNSVQWLNNIIEINKLCDLRYKLHNRPNALTNAMKYDVILRKKSDFSKISDCLFFIRSIICFDKISSKQKHLCCQNHILLWQKHDLPFDLFVSYTPSVPIIQVILSSIKKQYWIIKELEYRFRKEKYSVAAISDAVDSCMYGFFYANRNHIKAMLSYLERYVMPDVIFIVTDTIDNIKVIFDINVIQVGDAFIISYGTEKAWFNSLDELFSSLVLILTR